ncbi:MAG: hypothetical protein ACUVWV_15490 [Thermodesulfobacteriota bacterium]
MNYWMCSECNFVFQAESPPNECPSCHNKCTFTNVTCYIPECGGPEHLDRRLLAEKMRGATKEIKKL